MTDQDRELLEALTRLNAAITKFSMDLAARRVDHEAHLGMVLMLLNVADQTPTYSRTMPYDPWWSSTEDGPSARRFFVVHPP